MASRYSHLAGTAATETVPAGTVATKIRCHSSAGGTLIITPAGGSALPTITIPNIAAWFEIDLDPRDLELGSGATLAFASTDAYYVALRKVGN